MADVRTFEYKGKNVQVSVNKNGAHYLGEIEIEGMKLSANQRFGPEETSEEGAFRACERKAHELIDGTPTV